jgi:hypothetical protein
MPMMETINFLMLLALPIVYWRLRKRSILWLKLTIFLCFIANIILNQGTFNAEQVHDVDKFNKFYWLAFAMRCCVLALSVYGIVISFKRIPEKPSDVN